MTPPTARRLFLWASLAAVLLGGCANLQDFAARPADWGAHPTQTWPVQGAGDWARLRGKPMYIGPFATADLDYSLWATAPTQTRQVLGDEEDGLYVGTAQVGNSSQFAFTLTEQGQSLARIRCQQDHHQRRELLGYGDEDERSEIQELGEYSARLHCLATATVPSAEWSNWELSLQALPWRPLTGVLQVGIDRLAVVGSTRSSAADLMLTTSYQLRRGDQSLVLVDRLRRDRLEYWPDLPQSLQPAVVAAAMALFLANDPLEAAGD